MSTEIGSKPGMRPSGIDWIGEIPWHWDVRRIKHVARLASGHTPSRADPEYWINRTIPWFTLADISQFRDDSKRYVSETAEMISELGLLNSAAELLPPGTVALSRTASIGFSAILSKPMATSQDFANWVPGPQIRPTYLLYVLRAIRPELERLRFGSTHKTIYMPDIGKLVTPVPPLNEQDQIVRFLDEETARIDALLQKKENLVALLEEQQIALISKVLASGLKAGPPVRESGVAALDPLPESWSVVPLKHLAKIQPGLTLGKAYEGGDVQTFKYLRVANVQAGRLDLADIAEVHVPRQIALKHRLEQDDVLMTEGGDFDKLGRGFVWGGQISDCLHQNHIFALRCERRRLLPRYLAMLTLSAYGRGYFTATSKQSTNLASTNQRTIGAFNVPLPPIDEQEVILRHLDAEDRRRVALLTSIRRAIDSLKEYRSALITAAVTGEIDVTKAA